MTTRVPERIALAVLLLMLLTTPLLFGSVPGFDAADPEPGPWLAFFQALGPWHLFLFLAAALAIRPISAGLGRWLRRDLALPLGLLGALVLLALLQTVPVPPPVQRLLAPAAAAHREALGVAGWQPVSWEPRWTGLELLRLAAYVIVLAAAVHLRGRRIRWILAGAIVAVASGEAAYGMLERYVLGNGILGFAKLTGTDEVTGTFINRNHLAALLEIGLPAALAMLLYRRRAPGRDGRPRPLGLPDALLVAAALLMAAGVVLTVSRGAYGALFGGLLVFLFLAYGLRRGAASKATLAVFVVLLAVVPLLLVKAFEPLEKRFSYGVSDRGFFDVRFPAWKSTLRLVADQPVLGTGLGSYRHAIHAYQSPEVAGELYYAHDDYLNLLADGGIAGLGIGLLFALACLRLALRNARGPEGQSRSLGIAAIAATAGVGLHSLFEFNLQIPGVVVPLLVLLGLGMTQADEPEPTPLGRWKAILVCGWPILTLLLGWTLLLPQARWTLDASRARGYLAAGRPEEAARLFAAGLDELGEGKARLALAEVASERGDSPAARVAWQGARRSFEEAARETPLRAEPWYRLGLVDLAEGKVEDAFRHFRSARRFARGLGEMNYRMGVALVLLGSNRRDETMIAEGADALREAGAIEPDLFTRGFDVVERFVKDVGVLRRMTPETAYGKARLVALLLRAGRRDEAIEEQAALERIDPTPAAAFGLAELLARAGRYEEAETPLRRYLRRAGVSERTLQDVYRLFLVGERRGPARDFFRSLVDGPARGHGHAHYLLALILSDLGDHEGALQEIRRAIPLASREQLPVYRRKEEAILSDRAAGR